MRQVEMQSARLSSRQFRFALRRVSELNFEGIQAQVTAENIAQYAARSYK